MAFKLFKKKPSEKKAVAQQEPKKEVQRPVVPVGPVTSFGVIKHPLMTEKALRGADVNAYTFVVYPGTTKEAVKQAIKQMYKVDVAQVNMINVPAKNVRRGKTIGQKSGFRKAVVVVKKGQKIEISK